MKSLHLYLSVLAISLGFTYLAWTAPVIPPQPEKNPRENAKPTEIKDRLTDADARDKKLSNSPHKVHVVKLLAGETYQVDLVKTAGGLDPYLRIEDSTGKQLAEDDDSGGNLNSRIVFKADKTDSYRLIATSFNTANGDYVLRVTPLPKPEPAAPGKVLDGDKGININDILGARDARDRVRRNSFAKTYPVKMVKGKTYTIEMDSNQIDSYLRVENANGQTLAVDDDSGGNLNARIVFTANQDGVYTVIATTFINNDTGMFNLRIQGR